jgi:MFS family permease
MFGFTIFFLFVLSLPAGRLADRFGPRPVVLVSAATMGTGLLLTSNVSNLWLGYITYGFGVGVATACAYVPMVSQVSGWFDRRRAAALGVAVSGIGLGTLFGPRLASRLIDAHGWRDTYRIFAVVAVAALVLASFGAERAPVRPAATPLDLRAVVRTPAFRSLYISGLLLGLALFVPFVFLPKYAQDHGISSETAALLLSFLGVGSLIGRLVLGPLGGRLGVLRLYWLCFLVMAGSFVIWLVGRGTFAVLATFAVILGIAYGGYVALAPAVSAHLFGLSGLGAILGAMYTASGVGGLVGPPVAGRLIDHTDGYEAAIVFALVSAATARVFQRGPIARPT